MDEVRAVREGISIVAYSFFHVVVAEAIDETPYYARDSVFKSTPSLSVAREC